MKMRILGLTAALVICCATVSAEKLAKPGAVRIPNLVNGRSTIEKYLKKNKAVLVKRATAISA